MFTKPAGVISLVPFIDPLLCGMDIITTLTFIAYSIMPLYYDIVFQHFKDNTNVF